MRIGAAKCQDYTDAMSLTYSVGQTPRTLGGLLSLSVRLLFRVRPMLRIAAFVMVPFGILQIFGAAVALLQTSALLGDGANALLAASVALVALCIGIANALPYLAYPAMEGALAHRVIEEALGRTDRGARGSYQAVARRWPALFGTSLLRQVALALLGAIAPAVVRGVTVAAYGDAAAGVEADWLLAAVVAAVCGPLGLVALVVLLRTVLDWTLRAPVIVAEGAGGFVALRRSRELIQGQRWAMFGRLLPLGVLHALFISGPALLFTAWLSAPDAQPWMSIAAPVALIIGAVGAFFLAPFEAIFLTLNYLDLRVRRENLLSDLAAAGAASEAAPAIEVQPMPDAALTAPATPAQRIISLLQRMRQEGESCPLWVDLAEAYRDVGALGAALDALERARKVEPVDPEIMLAIAGVHRARRDAAAARAALHAYLELNPDPAARSKLEQDAQWRALLGDAGAPNGR